MIKRVSRVLCGATLLSVLSAPVVRAGPYADDLSRCLVSSTTAKDKTELIRWVFAEATLHPDVGSLAAVTDTQRTDLSRTAGQMIERLLTESCKQQFRDALKYEGNQTIETAFSVLGQVAMKGLMEHPAVAKGFGQLDTFVNADKLKAAIQPDEPSQ